jgi:Spy/CpxP family protein refolding chaperone
MGRDLERLNRPYVLQELKVTDSQRARIDAVMADLRREQAKSLPPWGELSRAQREAEIEKLGRMVEQAHDQVAAILTPSQMQRLRQIHFQYEGAFALREDDIAAELGLTPQQRQQIQKIYREHIRAVTVPASLARDPKAERAEVRRFRQVYQRNQRRILAVLTGEQRDRFLQMLGRPLPNLEHTFLFRLRKS